MSPTDQQQNAPGEEQRTAMPPAITDVCGYKILPGAIPSKLRSEFTYSVISADPVRVKASDKRGTERLRTRLRAGQLSDRRNKVIVDCIIQDRSRAGARLRLALDRPLPKTFLLSDDLSQARFLAELAWQRGRDAGVRLKAL